MPSCVPIHHVQARSPAVIAALWRLSKATALVLLAGGLAACQSEALPYGGASGSSSFTNAVASASCAVDTETDTLQTVNAQLDRLIGPANCHRDTECHSVAVGARACGGPENFRAYSDSSASRVEVEALAERQRKLAQSTVRHSARVSICQLVVDPGARCNQGVCVTASKDKDSGNIPAAR